MTKPDQSMNESGIDASSCKTAFTDREILSESQALTIASALLIAAPLIAVINLLLCISLIKTKQAKLVSQRFILILGISDFTVGALTAPGIALTFLLFHRTKICWFEKLSLCCGHFNTRFTAYVVFLIGLDRYMNINIDFRSKNPFGKMIQSKVGHVVLLGTALATTAVQASLAVIDFENRSLPNSISSAFDATIYFTYLFIYIRLYYKIRKFSRNNSLHLGANENGPNAFRPTYVRNLIKTVLYLLLTVGFCYLPYVIMKFAVTYMQYRLNRSVGQNLRFTHYLSFLPIVFNSFLNTLIILNRNSVLKEYLFAKVICCRKDLSIVREVNQTKRLTLPSLVATRDITRKTCENENNANMQPSSLAFKTRRNGRNSKVRFNIGNNVILPAMEDINSGTIFIIKNEENELKHDD